MSRSYKVITIIMLLSGLLVACDTWYGVGRGANFNHFIDHNCVGHALKNVEGISDIKYQFREGGRPLTITGLEEPHKLHYYFYKTQGINGYIYVSTNYKQESKIRQTYQRIFEPPPQAHIDIIRPVMDQIEKEIGPSCGIENFQEIMEEDCSEEIQCP